MTGCAHRGRQRLFLGLVWRVVALLSALPATAVADHGVSTARVGDASGQEGPSSLRDEPGRARVSASALYSAQIFDRVLQGTTPYDKVDFGRVDRHTLTLRMEGELSSRTQLRLEIPAGVVHIVPPEERARNVSGVGDLSVSVGQELLRELFGAAPNWAFVIRGGLLFPTGRYEREAALSATDVAGAADGTLNVVVYDTRAGLGAGSYSPLAIGELEWRFAKPLRLLAVGGLAYPITRTPDGIRWGPDESAQLMLGAEVVPGRLQLISGAEYVHHHADEVPVVDTPGGVERTGGSDELAALIGLKGRATSTVTLGAGGRLPFWQHVRGVKLVQTASAYLYVTVAWDFGDDSAGAKPERGDGN